MLEMKFNQRSWTFSSLRGTLSVPAVSESMSSKCINRPFVVIRGLPPTLTEEDFAGLLEKYAPGACTWKVLYRGDIFGHKGRPAVAFASLKTKEDIAALKEKLEAHSFVSDRGQTFRASLEYAPQQKCPRGSRKDPREGTIEKDKAFKDFLQQLEAGPAPRPKPDPSSLAPEPAGPAKAAPKVTPLMQFLQEKHKKKAEEKLRSRFKGKTAAGTVTAVGSGSKGAGPLVLVRPPSASGAAGGGDRAGSKAEKKKKGAKVAPSLEPIPDAPEGPKAEGRKGGRGKKDKGGDKERPPEDGAKGAVAQRPQTAPVAVVAEVEGKKRKERPPKKEKAKGSGGDKAGGVGGEGPSSKPTVVAVPVSRKKEAIVDRPAPTIDPSKGVMLLKRPLTANASEFKPAAG